MPLYDRGFQSSPAPEDGRRIVGSRHHQLCRCFNPRPPQRTGATPRLDRSDAWPDVSILARPKDGRRGDTH